MQRGSFGRYDIIEPIGHGGMAEVFRAELRDGPLAGLTVALKRLLPRVASDAGYIDMFLHEADLTRQLNHPNIIKVLETGAVGDDYYIAMEYVDGKDLGQILRRCATLDIFLPVDFACFVAHQVALALDHAHKASGPTGEPLCLVHRDVTPSNVFISRLGEIKLGDFGIALTNCEANSVEEVGTPGKVEYMSPEQIRGEPLTVLTDLFSLGALFYELLTNRKAFTRPTVRETWLQILDGDYQPPGTLRTDLPEEVERVVLNLLASGHKVGLLERFVGRGPPAPYASAADAAQAFSDCYDSSIGNPLAIASVVRGLFGASSSVD